jgi:hypothetical protein
MIKVMSAGEYHNPAHRFATKPNFGTSLNLLRGGFAAFIFKKESVLLMLWKSV